jgi:hypothetical protein
MEVAMGSTVVVLGGRLEGLYSNCVVVTLKAELAGAVNNEAFSETYRFTRVWVQRQKGSQAADLTRMHRPNQIIGNQFV